MIPGIVKSVFGMYLDFPDVVFSKGGSESFPPVLAARILGIPIMIHESDAVPGKANVWAGKFAKRIAVSFAGSAEYFPKGEVAVVGNPIRKRIFRERSFGGERIFPSWKTERPQFLFSAGRRAPKI